MNYFTSFVCALHILAIASVTLGDFVNLSKQFESGKSGIKNLLKSTKSNWELSYSGKQQTANCAFPEWRVNNGELNCANNRCLLKCIKRYSFDNGETQLNLKCINGEWKFENFESVEVPSCKPICQPPCQNQGICTQPGQCNCPNNFMGTFCEKKKVLCLNPPKLPRNSAMRIQATTSTITCRRGYVFPDQTAVANLECLDGEWVPTRRELSELPDCQPTCKPVCENGGVCLSLNVCQCPPDRRGPTCQFDAEVCNPKERLGFNGIYNCSGDSSQMKCDLSCPAGVKVSAQITNPYVCRYESGQYGTQEIPKCIYPPGMTLTSSSSSSSHANLSESHYTSRSNRKKIKKTFYEAEGDDEEDEEYEKIITTKVQIKKKKPKKSRGGYYEIEEEEEEEADTGMYAMYLTSGTSILTRTPTSATCTTWNGNKVKTFDGLIYSTQLRCSHTLVKDVKDGLFSVILRSCPAAGVKCNSTAVEIFLDNKIFTFEVAGNGLRVSTENRKLLLPLQRPEIRAIMLGNKVKIALDSVGITVVWDLDEMIAIESTAALWNRTGGLCGTLDGDVSNDFRAKDGSIAKTVNTFVDTWTTPLMDVDRKDCQIYNEQSNVNVCNTEKLQAAETTCTNLIDSEKFSNCLKMINKRNFIKSCINDYCSCSDLKNPASCACASVSVLADDCQFRGVVFKTGWRDLSICPVTCPAGEVYRTCGPVFEPFCGSSVDEVNTVCNEGCFCPDQMLRSEGKCIQPQSCRCPLRGKLFEPHAVITKDCNTCQCLNGAWKCSDQSCGARCGAIGDPHYTTFDNRKYDFMGKCSYVMMRTPNVTIEAENVECSPQMSCVKSATIRFNNNGHTESLKLEQGRVVSVNGKELKVRPVQLYGGQVTIRDASSTELLVAFRDGLQVWWNGEYNMYIDAPPAYHNTTTGLCGTFNANDQDDFLTPEGDVEFSVTEFANKWRTNERCEFAADQAETPHPCQLNIENKNRAIKMCGILKGAVFNDCQWHVDPDAFYEDCLWDMCACDHSDVGKCLCPVLSAYATQCTKQGVSVNWRHSVRECAITCPIGQVFEECGDSCYRSCTDLQFQMPCKRTCVEGCRCPPGQSMSEAGECIVTPQCPCRYEGLQFEAGYKEVRPGSKHLELCTCSGAKWQCEQATEDDQLRYPAAADIKKQCLNDTNSEFNSCLPPEPITCKNMHAYKSQQSAQCQSGCMCKRGFVLDSFTHRCVEPDQCGCHHGGKSYQTGQQIRADCNDCTCEQGSWKCTQNVCPATCTAWGDSHFESFDGKDFDFQGVCSYVLSKGAQIGGGDSYAITIQNVLCGSLGVTCSKSVSISVLGNDKETLTLVAHERPAQLMENSRMRLYDVGVFTMVELIGLDVHVKWDRGTRVYITAGTRWRDRVQGLCGNYNGYADDDLKTPAAGLEASPTIFGDSWKLEDYCEKPSEQIDTCAAHPNRKIWAQRQCGLLKSDVFRPCHSEVTVDHYMRRCTYDACACDGGGDCECLCTAIAAYAHACSAKGVTIKWRTPEMCPMQCDIKCSEYSPCLQSSCPLETCDQKLGDNSLCSADTCVEGCQVKPCPDGSIYTNNTYTECVPKSTCKPVCKVENGITYYEGDVLSSDACHTCRCDRGKPICSGVPCSTPTPTTGTTVPQLATSTPSSVTMMPYADSQFKCRSGWSGWFNQDQVDSSKSKMKFGDNEPIPTQMLMNTLPNFAVCTRENVTNIECRSVQEHLECKQYSEDVECSLERGLVARGLVHDYEVRVYCECQDSKAPTTNAPIKQRYEIPKNCDPNTPNIDYPGDCEKFLQCSLENKIWMYVEKTCGPGTWFNPVSMICDWPASVLAVKPECGLPQIVDTTTRRTSYTTSTTPKPVTWGRTTAKPKSGTWSWTTKKASIETWQPPTTTTQRPAETEMLCPPNSKWHTEPVLCKATCHYYRGQLKNQGLCKSDFDTFQIGCVQRKTECTWDSLWRDDKLCTDLAHCTCMTKGGAMIKPGAVYKESSCEICQCNNNEYVCDSSQCENEIPIAFATEPTTTTLKHPDVLVVVESTKSPPGKCDRSRMTTIIDGAQPLPDDVFSASSFKELYNAPKFARIKKPSKFSWMPKINNEAQYLKISLPKSQPIYGIVLRGNRDLNAFVTSFKLVHSFDDITYHPILHNGLPQIFRGPIDGNTPVEHIFNVPIEAKFIHVNPLTWQKSIAVELDLLGCDLTDKYQVGWDTTTPIPVTTSTVKPWTTTHVDEVIVEPICVDPLGIENSLLGNDQVQLSSTRDTLKKAIDQLKLSATLGWRPALNTRTEHVIFDFQEPRVVTGLKTKGGSTGWVTSFNVKYSVDQLIWNVYEDQYRQPKSFLANYDGASVKFTTFDKPINARFVKIIPTNWHENIELKLEPIGCFEPYKKTTTPVPEAVDTFDPVNSTCGICDGVLPPPSYIPGSCHCNANLRWNGRECVESSFCPCIVGHIPYGVGTKYTLDDCSECTCLLGGRPQCQNFQCPPCKLGLRSVKKAQCVCSCEPCGVDEVLCPTSGVCIPESSWCDGIRDCPDDELQCAKTEDSTVKVKVIEKTTVIKTCPTPKCPPGFTIKMLTNSTNNKGQEHVTSIKIQTKKKTTMKLSSPDATVDPELLKTSNTPVENPAIAECAKFKCIPIRAEGYESGVRPNQCPLPKCPIGYKVLLEASSATGCANFSCELDEEIESVCKMTGKSFVTFDGTEYLYEICNHVLARGLGPNRWSISVSKNCPAKKVACTKQLLVEDQDTKLTIKLLQNLQLQINNIQYTPQQLQQSDSPVLKQFVISKVGNTLVLRSHKFSYWVSINSLGEIRVGVCKRQLALVDGLCGFFNQDASDDKRSRSGDVVASTNDFGDSWQVPSTDPTDVACAEPDAVIDQPACSKDMQISALQMCNTIEDATFVKCANAVDAKRFLPKCIDAACECLRSANGTSQADIKRCKCAALQSYAIECLATDLTLHLDRWRDVHSCQIECPAGQVFNECYRRQCEPSCQSVRTSETDLCPYAANTCFSGCYCPEGKLRSGDKCIEATECTDCTCTGEGKTQLLTYDRHNLNVRGDCTYLLTRDVRLAETNFEVHIKMRPCPSGTCVQGFYILYGKDILLVERDRIVKFVNKNLSVGAAVFENDGWKIMRTTADELLIRLPKSSLQMRIDLKTMAFSLTVPGVKYAANVEGLCGNCNQEASDDAIGVSTELSLKTSKLIRTHHNTLLNNATVFGQNECNSPTNRTMEEVCVARPGQKDPCAVLLNERIFGRCHLIVDPKPFVGACKADACQTPADQPQQVCPTIAAYAAKCLSNGICLDLSETDCGAPRKCPTGMQFEQCGCPRTCETQNGTEWRANTKYCPVPRAAACICPPGQVIRDQTCVPLASCHPCDTEGHVVGEKWQPDKCTECSCTEEGRTSCVRKQCAPKVCETGEAPRTLDEPLACCPTVICEPIATGNQCAEVGPLSCSANQQLSKITDRNGCVKHICECVPQHKCPPLEHITLQAGERILTDATGCCPVHKRICDKSECPAKLDECEMEYYEVHAVQTNATDCCPKYKCLPPKDKCIVKVDGIAKLRKAHEKWSTANPCVNQRCAFNANGEAQVVEDLQTCPHVDCPRGWLLKAEPGKCCKSCVQTQCVLNEQVLNVNGKVRSADNCTEYRCSEVNGTLLMTTTVETCPDVSACPPELRYSSGCCTLCKPIKITKDAETCLATTLSEKSTLGLVVKKTVKYGMCRNAKSIIGFTECNGACKSGTRYDQATFKQSKQCDCCQVDTWDDITIPLVCDTGDKLDVAIQIPKSCKCSACDNDREFISREQLLYPMDVRNDVSVQVQ